MRTLSLTLLLLAFAVPTAQAQTSRAARVLALMSAQPGVLVRGDRVFVPPWTEEPLSVCAGTRCAPVASSHECTTPECPGGGRLLQLEHGIADVADFPTDWRAFDDEVAALRADPALGEIAWTFGQHPETPPDVPPVASGPLVWTSPSRLSQFGWEIGLAASGGVLGSNGIALAGGEASAGFRYAWAVHNADDEIFAALMGNTVGVDLRAHAHAAFPSQESTGWQVLVGIAPALRYANEHDAYRLPSFYGVLLPELGLALRDARDPAWYVGWSFPVAFLVDEHLGLEARASAMLVDDWIPGDDFEVQVSFALGVVMR